VSTDSNAAPSFDRMRNMLVRAAEVRESEQQQIFDALDDIYARLAPVDSIGAMRKRLSELPDRTEVSVLAERLDEAMTRMEAQDKAIAAVHTAVDSIVEKLEKPFAQLDGRLDGMASRLEGVGGRMDGLEDKLSNIHRRLDELGTHMDKQDGKLDSIPSDVYGQVRERVDTMDSEVRNRIDESASRTGERVDSGVESVRSSISDSAERLDPGERLDSLTTKLESVTGKVDELADRLDKVEQGVNSQLGDLNGSVQSGLSKVDDALGRQPDSDELSSVVQQNNEESERRIGGQLDEAMATFAELMLGGGAGGNGGGGAPAPQALPAQTSNPAPRQQQRRNTNGRSRKSSSSSSSSESKSKASSASGNNSSDEAES